MWRNHQSNSQLTSLRQMRRNHITLFGTSICCAEIHDCFSWNKHLTCCISWTTCHFLWIALTSSMRLVADFLPIRIEPYPNWSFLMYLFIIKDDSPLHKHPALEGSGKEPHSKGVIYLLISSKDTWKSSLVCWEQCFKRWGRETRCFT